MQLYQQYYIKYGIGELSAYQRSGTEISALMNVASSIGGGDSQEITPEQIYPQLASDNAEPATQKIQGQMTGWNEMPDVKKQQFISVWLCDEDGIYNTPNII